MIYRQPGTVNAKQRLSLIGAGVCLVLGVATSLSHGFWFTHVISSAGEKVLCPELSTPVPAGLCPPVETEASHPVAVCADIHGGAMGTSTEAVVATERDSPISHSPQPPLGAPSLGEEPAIVDAVPQVLDVGKTKIRKEPVYESIPIPSTSRREELTDSELPGAQAIALAIVPALPLSSHEGVSDPEPQPDAEDDKNGQSDKQPSSSVGADTVVTLTDEGPALPDALSGTPLAEYAALSVNASPPPAPISRILLNESVITFGWGKHTLGPEADRDLEAVVQTLLQYPESTVEVAAHTDRTGPRDYNERLSRHRAHAVRSFLMEKGVAEIRIWWKGYGPSQPRVSDNTPAARARNRRAEVRVWGYSM